MEEGYTKYWKDRTEQERLRIARKKIGAKSYEIAEVLGLNRASYSNIERGSTRITLKILKVLYERFGLSTDFVLFGRVPAFYQGILRRSLSEKSSSYKIEENLTSIVEESQTSYGNEDMRNRYDTTDLLAQVENLEALIRHLMTHNQSLMNEKNALKEELNRIRSESTPIKRLKASNE